MQNHINIDAPNLPMAWFSALDALVRQGKRFTVDDGSYAGQTRLEADFIKIRVTDPIAEPRLPEMPAHMTSVPPPVSADYMEGYVPYMMSAQPVKDNETYTYGSRLERQIEEVIRKYNAGGHRTNQCSMSVATPDDIYCGDPPCLREIDTRVQDGELHLYCYFRSWDLWNGFPANLAAISYMQEYIALGVGVSVGELTACSKGLHVYGYVEDLARLCVG
jgi:thymidylate synthase